MTAPSNKILIINGGSSSIKFSLYSVEGTLKPVYSGKIERMNTATTSLSYTDAVSNERSGLSIDTSNNQDASAFLVNWFEAQAGFGSITAIGHRLVHGMKHSQPEIITSELLDELKAISMYDPDHLPEELKLIAIFRNRYPLLQQIACFDTSFHTSLPEVARLLPIPRKFSEMGIRRYGFHGISYAYLMEELEKIAGKEKAAGRILLAHLGSGASICIVDKGKCMDTSMGFTPTSGLVMGTRPGDMDPGVSWYLMHAASLTSQQYNTLINHECGLLGISETSSDMRDLLDAQQTDHRAAEAVELFCYQTKKWIGSFATVTNGFDSLVFSGGIGENAPGIRSRICAGLGFLGIELDEEKNKKNEAVISRDSSRVCVRVIHTNESLMIARDVCKVLNYSINNQQNV